MEGWGDPPNNVGDRALLSTMPADGEKNGVPGPLTPQCPALRGHLETPAWQGRPVSQRSGILHSRPGGVAEEERPRRRSAPQSPCLGGW